ncbi:hypothetical protein M728_001105 [Ensifer sp. WSM1721]|uniref:hypothetical protein n=1 Tax=Ensifer sp. WSM1721 TaxID=1041159 RepID=UPI00047D4797|nr:hypothetical protein [Ensifer sp. WSM1721]
MTDTLTLLLAEQRRMAEQLGRLNAEIDQLLGARDQVQSAEPDSHCRKLCEKQTDDDFAPGNVINASTAAYRFGCFA